MADKFQFFIRTRRVNEIEALVFGFCGYGLYPVVEALVSARKKLTNLRALFIGDIDNSECDYSSVVLSNVSQILENYLKLEVLKIRCSEYYGEEGLTFEPLKHKKLKALIIESGGLRLEIINEICALELPALEYLELGLGKSYWLNSSIEDLMPIFSSSRFPKLKYLGLPCSRYSLYIIQALIESPLIEQLLELNLSMGDLDDEAGEILLNCPAIHQLDTLNIDRNNFSVKMAIQLKHLDTNVILDTLNINRNDYENLFPEMWTQLEQFNIKINSDDLDGIGWRYCAANE